MDDRGGCFPSVAPLAERRLDVGSAAAPAEKADLRLEVFSVDVSVSLCRRKVSVTGEPLDGRTSKPSAKSAKSPKRGV